jgi:hypothetical protein
MKPLLDEVEMLAARAGTHPVCGYARYLWVHALAEALAKGRAFARIGFSYLQYLPAEAMVALRIVGNVLLREVSATHGGIIRQVVERSWMPTTSDSPTALRPDRAAARLHDGRRVDREGPPLRRRPRRSYPSCGVCRPTYPITTIVTSRPIVVVDSLPRWAVMGK